MSKPAETFTPEHVALIFQMCIKTLNAHIRDQSDLNWRRYKHWASRRRAISQSDMDHFMRGRHAKAS